MSTDTPFKLSFLKLMNSVKGIHKPMPPQDVHENWLENEAPTQIRKNWQEYDDHYKSVGVKHPKVKYPVMFGQGDNRYPGMLVTEDIGKEEVIVKVPGREIITTKKAFYSELKQIWFDHPDTFGKHVADGEDNMLHAFILYEIQKGQKSRFYQMIKMWPRDTDILMNWDEDDLDWLQDPTLKNEAEKAYNEMMDTWNRLYAVLSQYPDFFNPESISLYRFKWVTILTTNRCFSSNWPGVCQMVPFADQINHENVDVNYDCFDRLTGKSIMTKEEIEERQRKAS